MVGNVFILIVFLTKLDIGVLVGMMLKTHEKNEPIVVDETWGDGAYGVNLLQS